MSELWQQRLGDLGGAVNLKIMSHGARAEPAEPPTTSLATPDDRMKCTATPSIAAV